ncbi:carboxymuconolactone decarboxylase family protein [Acidaminobacter hydrogenoformans]|uniref:Alkylhydroperoxidase family enzyme, contains CxxC motif n=1 Tax=Acidaminobacter hydrogenoformans DSM 2784 TaxID=1120920 RepID=A0A1G5S422_9FIRM|nr:carboxymuconolactone decarboxylase family protein [Acidaminobacter hydrogenoformans]SCZ80918.1 Alkylhydroperoxidase family enzyme, contains CxxC motif [Acidaminobacter hydrogenoformans DSM 2784]
MAAFIDPPKKVPLFLRPGIWLAKKFTGKDLEVPRLLSWYPKAAMGSAALESLVAHKDKTISERMLKLVRMQASFTAYCPFCIDMNSSEYAKSGITPEELSALQDHTLISTTHSFSTREKLALEYARLISDTPLSFPDAFINALKQHFTEREIVILASTAAQVNYWARLIHGLGIPPAGFSGACKLPEE